MTADPKGFRPKRYPAPEFPPKQAQLFAATPPVIFTAVLALCALPPVFRRLLVNEELPTAAADLAGGIVLAIWLFSMLALAVKVVRRPAVIPEDLRVIPSRNGLFSATASVIVAAMILDPFAPGLALMLVVSGLAVHLVLAGLYILQILRRPSDSRAVDPGWQLIFAAPLLATLYLANSGYSALALILGLAMAVPVILVLVIGIVDLVRKPAAAPLRPMLVLHIGVLALLATLATELGRESSAAVFAASAVIGVVLMLGAVNWLTASGFTPVWGCLAWPLIAVADLLARSGATITAVLILLPVSFFTLWVCWRIFSLWAKGRLAAMTNSAVA